MKPAGRILPRLASLLPLLLLCGFTWPWNAHGPWPTSSDHPVTALAHPRLEAGIEGPYRFAAFGDQRALADGEWQRIVAHIARIGAADAGLRFVIDTGDIVDAGEHGDQWLFLRDILSPIAHLPYLVALGNHELGNNRDATARANAVAFLSPLDPAISAERLYYAKRAGRVRFLFLDTNDIVYGEAGEGPRAGAEPGGRTEAQMLWLTDQLADDDPEIATVVVMHHPPVQSSRKHMEDGAFIWSWRWREKTLPELFADGGVDLILSGNTHTYERFRLEREDGPAMQLVNLSGRPRDHFLWFGQGRRKARDIAGREIAYLAENGWRDLAGWRIEQLDAMVDGHENNFAVFGVDDAGRIDLTMHYLDEDAPSGLRSEPPVRVHDRP